MANSNGWGDGAANNTIGWGQGANNAIGWGAIYAVSSAGRTDIIGAVGTAPVNTVSPQVTGSAYVGDILTTTDGTWTGSPSSYAYQWQRNGTNIGTNTNTYTLVSADAGNNITCIVTATNASGSTPESSGVFYPNALAAPTIISPPEIDAVFNWVVGDTINFTGNVWDGNPVPTTFTYQWLRNNIDITGETSITYLTVSADLNKLISVKCFATNSQGAANITSNQVTIN